MINTKEKTKKIDIMLGKPLAFIEQLIMCE